MNRPAQRPLGPTERRLFSLYTQCRLPGVEPSQLYQAYALNYEQLARIAGCSLPTMTRWMNQHEPRSLKPVYQRRLGEFYFLLQHYREIPLEIWEIVCPLSPELRTLLYPPQSTANDE